MAGHVVSLYLRENGFTVDTLSAHNILDKDTWLVDVRDIEKLKKILDAKQYDVVVNCIGLLVKESDEKKDLAIYINSFLPHLLEGHYKNSETKIIHISTNGVFSSKNPPYKEDSKYDGESFYGRSKALGEIINSKDLTFRLSIIGPDMKEDDTSLFNWFFRQKGEIQGYTNVIWNGITTLELAKSIKAAIEQNLIGLYHLVPKDSISKFDLLQLFKRVFERNDIKITPAEGLALDTTLTNTRKDFNYQIPDYKTMIYGLKDWIKDHPKLYKHYEKS